MKTSLACVATALFFVCSSAQVDSTCSFPQSEATEDLVLLQQPINLRQTAPQTHLNVQPNSFALCFHLQDNLLEYMACLDSHPDTPGAPKGPRPTRAPQTASVINLSMRGRCFGSCPTQELPSMFRTNLISVVKPTAALIASGSQETQEMKDPQSAVFFQEEIETLDVITDSVRAAVTSAWEEGMEIVIWTDELPHGEFKSHLLGIATQELTLNEIISNLRAEAMDAWQSGEVMNVMTDRRSISQSTDIAESGHAADERQNEIQPHMAELTQEHADLLNEMISGLRVEAASAWETGEEIVVFSDRHLSGTTHFLRKSFDELESAGGVGISAGQTEQLEHILSGIRSDAILAWGNGEELAIWTDQRNVE